MENNENGDKWPNQGAGYVPLHLRLNADPSLMEDCTKTANEIQSFCMAVEDSIDSNALFDTTQHDVSTLHKLGNVETAENDKQPYNCTEKEMGNLTEVNRDKCNEKDKVVTLHIDDSSENTEASSGDSAKTDKTVKGSGHENEGMDGNSEEKHIEEATEEDVASEGSDQEYESAEEGEELNLDQLHLRDMENELSDEQKEEKRESVAALKEEGNELFRTGSYKSAIIAYSRALRACPLKFARDRAILYSNKAACKMRLEMYEECIRDCTKAIELHPHYLKAVMRRAEIYEKLDKLDEALADYQKILELDPGQHSARAACLRLPDQIKERNEKLKTEMIGKLKELGNMVLRPFGLSTNNFQLNQDPNTGGYSVNFVQNTPQQ
ncbi:tetratricopeptide repeat protein 1-like isoform X2 [Dreissena polymorpha]|uniref:Tetratricopeptide repeat protein 1 n=1 Tax=Dreissena polymorpha TaxID=45954 RepID=A0A9D4EWC6_DREPO|nr:tetratricopeptide repeat protein 1-like isoform X2 [Dreissena polymorpha]KAH3787028.1 hypothetical protein DPMN_165147 [Dreissena polymorpha]